MPFKLQLNNRKTYKIIEGDCIEVMKSLPENSVHAIICDPPYAISIMGKEFDTFKSLRDYSVFSNLWARKALRVLKPGGYLLAFSGSRTYHYAAVGIEEAGFICRDMIVYVYGSGMPKSYNVNGHINKTIKLNDWQGYGTNLKPAIEPIAVFQKPLIEKTIAANCLKWGVGAINIDAGRIKANERLGRHNKQGKTSTLFDINREDHSTEVSVYVNNSHAGRWPSNLIHDGSQEIVNQFPNSKDGVAVSRNKKKGKHSGNVIYGKCNVDLKDVGYGGEGSAARFFYCAKPSTRERDEGLHDLAKIQSSFWQTGNGASGKPSSIEKNRKPRLPRANTHPTVKPIELMRYLVSIYCPHDGIVLDPFMGSGTTGIGCIKANKQFIGIEKDPQYFDIASRRIAHHFNTHKRIK